MTTLVPADRLEAYTRALLESLGMPGAAAAETAQFVVGSDRRGIDSHGVSMLPQYVAAIRAGRVDLLADPVIEQSDGGTCMIDGGHGMGHRAMGLAIDEACRLARSTGIAAAGVRRSNHFGALGVYAERASQQGLVAIVTTTTRTVGVVPTRSAAPLLGTNPIAIAAPSDDPDRPFVLDMSTSTVAINKVKIYSLTASPLQSGWVLDGAGEPVTDAVEAYRILRDPEASGGLAPLGGAEPTAGYKGYGLSLAVQILAGALTGSTFAATRPADQPNDDIGHFCIVIDPARFGDGRAFQESVGEVFRTMDAAPTAPGSPPVLVPGDPERQRAEIRRSDGVPLSEGLLAQLDSLAAEQGIAPLSATLGV